VPVVSIFLAGRPLWITPEIEGMILVSVCDHVQAPLDKPDIRQAFEAWRSSGTWV
jgi:hypothetical protein